MTLPLKNVPSPATTNIICVVGDDIETLNKIEVTHQSSFVETIPFNVPCNNKNNVCSVRDDLENPEEEVVQQGMSQSSSVSL